MVKKVLLITIGLVMLLFCGLTAAAGGLVVAFIGTDNQVDTGWHRETVNANALQSSSMAVRNASDVPEAGNAAIRVSARSTSQPMFIGVGPADQVSRYLADAAVEEVTGVDMRPYRLRTVRREGSVRPEPPGTQTFWLSRVEGPNPDLRWEITEGDYRIVVMNADASAGLDAEMRFGVDVPGASGVGLAMLIGGGLLALAGLALLIWGIAARTRPAAGPVARTAPVGGPAPVVGPAPGGPGTDGPGTGAPGGAGGPFEGRTGGSPGAGGYPEGRGGDWGQPTPEYPWPTPEPRRGAGPRHLAPEPPDSTAPEPPEPATASWPEPGPSAAEQPPGPKFTDPQAPDPQAPEPPAPEPQAPEPPASGSQAPPPAG